MGYSKSKGITRMFKHQHNDPLSLLADKALDLYIDDFENLWIATNKGINIWDPERSQMHSFPADYKPGTGLKSQFINNLGMAYNGTIWVSTWDGGLHKVTGDLNDLHTIEFLPVFELSTDAFTSDPGALWITSRSELYRMDLITQQVSRIESVQTAANGKNLHHLIYSNKGSIWLGTENGLVEYNIHEENTRFFPIQSDRDIAIISLEEDVNGNIWCCSLSSLFKFDVNSQEFKIFPIGDEIPLKGFRPRSCCKTGNGELVFAGQDGFIVFNPDSVSLSDYQPEVGISELHVQNKRVMPGRKINGQHILDRSIFFEDEVSLRYDHRSVTFSFASLDYGDMTGKIFAYKLEGYDTGWKYTSGNQNSAIYSNLPTGKYKLLLRGSNTNGVWSTEMTSLRLRIKPPPLASPGFIAIYVFIIVILLFLIIYVYRIKANWLKRLEEIRMEKERNEEMALLKQQLFTNISHEFRTPLSLISGPTQEILEKNSIDPENRKLVELISKNSHRLLRLVNQLIDFRKAEVGRVKLNESFQDMVEFCSQVYHQFSDRADRKNIDYSFSTDEEKLVSGFDQGKMETLLNNLLSNAFNYTPDHGRISMVLQVERRDSGAYEDGNFTIRVKDNGKGIGPEDLPKIFDRFYQGGNGKQTSTGSGIGLTMVKEYAELHNGTVKVHSALNEGSTFEVTIPIKPAPATPKWESTGPLEQEFVTDTDDILHEKSEFKDRPVYTGIPVILLVEDNSEVIDFIKIGLADKYNFRFAENGNNALKLVERELPDLIISDVMMPEMDGYSLCTSIKENPKTRHIPVILLSALTLTDQQIEGLKCGADAYVTKPFVLKYLDALIENLFQRKEFLVEYVRMQSILNPTEIEVTSSEEKILKQVITFIESQISDPELNVKSICQATGFTHSYLYRSTKRATGGTLNELIKDIRIKRAAQLLKTRKLTIAEVMVEVGFSNHSYFSKCFRKVYGMPPGSFLENPSSK